MNYTIYLFLTHFWSEKNGDRVKTFFRNELHHVRTFYREISRDFYTHESNRTHDSTSNNHIASTPTSSCTLNFKRIYFNEKSVNNTLMWYMLLDLSFV